jgi:acyl carrier protein
MTRNEVVSKITELFKEKYGINLLDYPEDTDVTTFSELNEKLDSIEFMNFIFDVEDMFGVENSTDDVPTKLGDLFDMFEKAINEKQEKESKKE